MIRKIITIDRYKCNGCGLCADACHEGAIEIVNGKACLLREDHCDGLGDCLPACPMGAISFEEREAAEYREAVVQQARRERNQAASAEVSNQLNNFPIQIKLAPVTAPVFQNADLLIAADCTAFSFGNFHNVFMKNRITLIGCPKLDNENYADKLSQIIRHNSIRSITVSRMTVPCCGGLPFAVRNAVAMSGKEIPVNVVTVSPNGDLVG